MIKESVEEKSLKDLGGKTVGQSAQKGRADMQKDKMKALIKKKLKPVHQEIIAPPGQ